jgi:transposase
MSKNGTYFPRSTAQQRKLLFETWEATGSIAEACARAHLSRVTFHFWKPRFEEQGYAGLEQTHSCRPKHLARKKSQAIEDEVIAMRRAHTDWGKKRIEQEIAKGHNWMKVVSYNAVRRILRDAGLWSEPVAGKKKKLANPL